MSRTEHNEHAQSCGWLRDVGVSGGPAGREDRGTHHLLQPKRDDGFEGEHLCLNRSMAGGEGGGGGCVFRWCHICSFTEWIWLNILNKYLKYFCPDQIIYVLLNKMCK